MASKKNEEKKTEAPVTQPAPDEHKPVPEAASAPEAPAIDPTIELKIQAKTLQANLDALERQLAEQQKENDRLTNQLSAAAKINERLSQREHVEHAEDRKVTIDGLAYEVVDVDTALEIVDKVRKSYVEQDAPVAVLKRSR